MSIENRNFSPFQVKKKDNWDKSTTLQHDRSVLRLCESENVLSWNLNIHFEMKGHLKKRQSCIMKYIKLIKVYDWDVFAFYLITFINYLSRDIFMKSEEKRLIYFQQLRVHHSGVPGGDITTSRSCPRSIMVTNIFTKLEDNQAKNIWYWF